MPTGGRRVYKGLALSPRLVYPSGMASADQADGSSEDTTSSSDETDLEVIATHPQSGLLQTSNPPGAWPEASPPSGTGVTSPRSVGVLG